MKESLVLRVFGFAYVNLSILAFFCTFLGLRNHWALDIWTWGCCPKRPLNTGNEVSDWDFVETTDVSHY